MTDTPQGFRSCANAAAAPRTASLLSLYPYIPPLPLPEKVASFDAKKTTCKSPVRELARSGPRTETCGQALSGNLGSSVSQTTGTWSSQGKWSRQLGLPFEKQ